MQTRVLPSLALATTLLLGTAGCFGQDGGDDGPVSEDRTPQEVMELAKQTLDEAEGVQLDLYAVDLPREARTALIEANGIVVRPASFEGEGKVRASGFEVDVEMRAIDDDFWVKSPVLGNSWVEVDPGEYGIPNPNELMAPEGGLSELLLENEGLEEGDSVRGGDNNDEVLTSFTGTLPGDAVEDVVSIASGDGFDMEYLVADNGELREIRITGEFYGGKELTYVVNLDDYGTTREIRAP
jgi:lipoprotein LprG